MTCKLRSRSSGELLEFDNGGPGSNHHSFPRNPEFQSETETGLLSDSTLHGCPHHPSSAMWYWKSKCLQCSRKAPSDVSEYRFARWPLNDSYSVSLNSLPPTSNEGLETPSLTRRERRRSLAASKYPYTYPRKGSDTNPSTLSGRVLSIYREGLSTIGRTFTMIPSATPWKCYSHY